MCTPSLARFFERPVTLPWRVKGSSGLPGELRVRMAPGRGTVFVCRSQPAFWMLGRNHGSIQSIAGCSGSLCKAGVQSRARVTPVLCRKC
jgi:hypothetical protein